MIKTITFFMMLWVLPIFIWAQPQNICPDVEGSKDHPAVTRFPNSCILGYDQTDFNEIRLPLSKVYRSGTEWIADREAKLQGKITQIVYGVNAQKSTLEIIKNYEDALRGAGYEILFSCGSKECSDESYMASNYLFTRDDAKSYKYAKGNIFSYSLGATHLDQRYLIAKGQKNGMGITVAIYTSINAGVVANIKDKPVILVKIVEQKAMQTGQVTAAEIDDAMKKDGKMAFYGINFDLGSDRIKPESESTIKLMADYLNSHRDKSFFIVGHTDNTGTFSNNLTLSEKRSLALVNELKNKHGVSAAQLEAKGVASLCPVASNENEAGKAKNRRVELVAK